MILRGAEIGGISYYLPEEVLTNEDLVAEFGTWTPKKILSKTGIRERRVVTTEPVSEMAVRVAEKFFSQWDVAREDVDLLLLCTETPDYVIPSTACVVHDRLGLRKDAGAFDYNLGCSGYIYGLAMARAFVVSGMASKVLLLTGDVMTRLIHPMDKSTRTIFGDGFSATLVQCCDSERIGEFLLCTDGSGAQNLIIPAGGMAMPCSEETSRVMTNRYGNSRTLENLYMNGPEILDFAMREVPEVFRRILERNSTRVEDIGHFIFHQASTLVLEKLRDELNIPEDRFYITLQDKGNTISSSIPIALAEALESGRLKRGDRAMLLGFGVGYSWGGVVVEL